MRYTLVSVYINPTSERRRNNRAVIEKLEKVIKSSILMQKHIIIGGDWNYMKDEIQSLSRVY